MKKLGFMIPLFVFFVSVVMGASKVAAYPFLEVEGFVTDLSNVSYSGDFATLDVTYRFDVAVADGGAEMNGLSLEFEGDVFTSVNSLTFNNPLDWISSEISSSGGSIYKITSAGTTLGQGKFLEFTTNVTMYSLALNNVSGDWDGNGTINNWTEGQIWGQSFTARDTNYGNDGGSTAPAPVPEPATLLLLSGGLFGVSVLKKREKSCL